MSPTQTVLRSKRDVLRLLDGGAGGGAVWVREAICLFLVGRDSDGAEEAAGTASDSELEESLSLSVLEESLSLSVLPEPVTVTVYVEEGFTNTHAILQKVHNSNSYIT